MNQLFEQEHQKQSIIKIEQYANYRGQVTMLDQKQSKNSNECFTQGKHTKLIDNPVKSKERTRVKAQIWDLSQIRKIFGLYQEYGSQWKIIQSDFQDRAANSIKNRFYTVIRTMLKLLFKWNSYIKEKLPHEIPSKAILKFYEGKEEFVKFKGFGKKILKLVDFDLDSTLLRKVAQQNSDEVLALYECIFGSKSECSSQRLTPSKKLGNKQRKEAQQRNSADGVHQDWKNSRKDSSIKNITIGSETCLGNDENLMPGCCSPQFEGVVFFLPFTSYFEMPIMSTCYTLI